LDNETVSGTETGLQQGQLDISTTTCQHSKELLVPEQSQLYYFQRGAEKNRSFLPLKSRLEARTAVYLKENKSQVLNSKEKEV
jgi:hypothetical protein